MSDNSAETKVSEDGGGRGSPGAKADFPLQPMVKTIVKTMVSQAVTLQPMEVHGGAYPPAAPGGCHDRAGGCLKETVTLWEIHAPGRTCGPRERRWSRSAGRTCDSVGDMNWSSLLLKDCSLWKELMLEQILKNYSLWEALILEKFMEDCLLWEGPMLEQEKSVKSTPPNEKGAAETTCDELSAAAISIPLCQGIWSEVEPCIGL